MAETRRVYEIADAVGRESGEVLAWLQAHGHPELTTHASALPADVADAAIEAIKAEAAPEGEPAPKMAAQAAEREDGTEAASRAEPAPGEGPAAAQNEAGEPSQGERAGRRKRRTRTDPGSARLQGRPEASPSAEGPPPTSRRRRAATAAEEAQPERRYRLVRRASVGAPGLRVEKEGTISVAQYAALPDRVRAYFDEVKG